MDMQHLFLVGRATKDAEEFTSKSEKKFSKFSLAINEYNAKTKEENATFYDVLVFGKMSEKVVEKVKKGDRIMVQGRPEVEAYLSKKGKEPKASISVIAEDWKVMK